MNTFALKLITAAVMVAIPSMALAQQTPQRVSKPASRQAVAQPTAKQAIASQSKGQYPTLSRSALPKGAINQNWAASCAEEDSITSVIYSPSKELRVRTRQLIGTVIVFPEVVSALTSGLGNIISLKAYPNDKSTKSKIWILGAREAGVDGNVAFIGRPDLNSPRIYSLHVQTEGLNTVNCPDLVFQIRGTTDQALEGVAGSILQKMNLATGEAPPAAVAEPDERQLKTTQELRTELETDSLTGTGRQEVDWLEGFRFDPSRLDFRWKLGGDPKTDFAPDIVFSDDAFLYLQWDEKRMQQMMLPAISVVVKTDKGKLDAPVSFVKRGNTIIVQRVANLTLELEGIVVCVVRDDGSEVKE